MGGKKNEPDARILRRMENMRRTGMYIDILEELEKKWGKWIMEHEPWMLEIGKGSAAWKKEENEHTLKSKKPYVGKVYDDKHIYG